MNPMLTNTLEQHTHTNTCLRIKCLVCCYGQKRQSKKKIKEIRLQKARNETNQNGMMNGGVEKQSK